MTNAVRATTVWYGLDHLAALARSILVGATRWRRRSKLVVSAAVDAVLLSSSIAILLFAYRDLCGCGNISSWLLPACVAIVILSVWLVGGYRQVLRHWSARLHISLLLGSAIGALGGGVLFSRTFGTASLFYSFPLLWVACFGPMVTWRALGSMLLFRLPRQSPEDAAPLVVYGAGVAGAGLVAGLQREAHYDVVALIDDNPDLQGRTVHGCPILPPETLDDLLARKAVAQVVVAIPSATVEQRRRILNRLAHFPVQVRTLPPLSDIVAGRSTISEIREVTPEELLSREPVRADLRLLHEEICGKAVLVTGGGGSIGSALCREILRHGPARLVVFEVSEFALYKTDRELRELADEICPTVEINSVLGSILTPRDLDQAIGPTGVDIIYHAAAYKHVPLVEMNPMRGVENNVIGTVNVAQAAQRRRVGKFVLISTDKAVRPTNVMGASKRLAEKVVEALSKREGSTRFALVRFGNVLDSAGSVVPLFREQIERGGPVTVTHADVTRYFMTIPEAAELVIQAGAMAGPGVEVFHLDMGEPVRIADLARKLIHLSGYKVANHESGDGEGIAIHYVGLRPGEKLYEELLVDATAAATEHPRIFRARDVSGSWAVMQRHLQRLNDAIERCDRKALRQVLHDCVEDYGEPAELPEYAGAAD